VDFVLETLWRPPLWRLYGDPRYGDFMETPVRLGDLDSLLFFLDTLPALMTPRLAGLAAKVKV